MRANVNTYKTARKVPKKKEDTSSLFSLFPLKSKGVSKNNVKCMYCFSKFKKVVVTSVCAIELTKIKTKKTNPIMAAFLKPIVVKSFVRFINVCISLRTIEKMSVNVLKLIENGNKNSEAMNTKNEMSLLIRISNKIILISLTIYLLIFEKYFNLYTSIKNKGIEYI